MLEAARFDAVLPQSHQDGLDIVSDLLAVRTFQQRLCGVDQFSGKSARFARLPRDTDHRERKILFARGLNGDRDRSVGGNGGNVCGDVLPGCVQGLIIARVRIVAEARLRAAGW